MNVNERVGTSPGEGEGAEGVAALGDDHPALYVNSKSFWPVRDIIIAGARRR
jgi:hypothetical protein